MGDKEGVLHGEGDGVLEQVAQTSYGCPTIGIVQGQTG